MKTLLFNSLLAFSVLFLFVSCNKQECIDCGIPVEANLIISDTKGRPVKNHQVSLSGFVSKQIHQTDENGAVRFDFLWNNAIKDAISCWAIYPADGYDIKRTSILLSPNTNSELKGKITIMDTLFMDPLTTFRVRVKTSRNDVKQVKIDIEHDGFVFDENKFLGIEGFSGIQQGGLRQNLKSALLGNPIFSSTPKLDTTIEVKVFETLDFRVGCSFGYLNPPTSAYKLVKVGSTFPRDSILLIQF